MQIILMHTFRDVEKYNLGNLYSSGVLTGSATIFVMTKHI